MVCNDQADDESCQQHSCCLYCDVLLNDAIADKLLLLGYNTCGVLYLYSGSSTMPCSRRTSRG